MEKDIDNELDKDTDDNEDVDAEKDEFEYDEDGNIIIPDVIDEDADEDENIDVDLEQDETDDAESDENEGSDEDSGTEEVVEPATDEKDKRIADLEKELKALKSQGKDTLSKLGVKDGDLLEGLEKLAAEADDVSVEDYRKSKSEKEKLTEAQQLLQRAEFEKKAAADLAELQKYYPETKSLNSIVQIENLAEFGRLRDLGLTPKQAYAAANPDGVKTHVAEAVKQQSLNDTKKHLQSAVPKGSKDTSITMTKKELSEWRDMFPKLSDKEIAALYKSSITK